MTRLTLPALLLGATALSVPLATPAAAQGIFDNFEIDREGACEQLLDIITRVGEENLLPDFQEAPAIAEQNEAEACIVVLEDAVATGSIAVAEAEAAAVATETETFRETETLTETVTIEQRAIVEGEVLVAQPIPQVEVEQGPVNVQVGERPVGITVDEQPANILVRQRPANVRVAIARPTVTIEQPAPEIIVTMPAPGLTVDQVEPDVNVVAADPVVTVTQPDPEVSVDVQAELVAAEEFEVLEAEGRMPEVATRIQRLDPEGQVAEEDAEVAIVKAKPTVRFIATDQQPEYVFNRVNPQVVYEPAEPNIEVMFNEEPRVEIRQVGEPRVQIRRAGEMGVGVEADDEALLEGEDDTLEAAALGEGPVEGVGEGIAEVGEGVGEGVAEVGEGVAEVGAGVGERLSLEDTNRFLGMEEGYEVGEAELTTIGVGDLAGSAVVTIRGEELGEIEEVASSGGELYAVIEHGGFLGIGEDQVAIPLERLAMRGNEIILLGLDEEQLSQMPNYDFNNDEVFSENDTVEIGRFE